MEFNYKITHPILRQDLYHIINCKENPVLFIGPNEIHISIESIGLFGNKEIRYYDYNIDSLSKHLNKKKAASDDFKIINKIILKLYQ